MTEEDEEDTTPFLRRLRQQPLLHVPEIDSVHDPLLDDILDVTEPLERMIQRDAALHFGEGDDEDAPQLEAESMEMEKIHFNFNEREYNAFYHLRKKTKKTGAMVGRNAIYAGMRFISAETAKMQDYRFEDTEILLGMVNSDALKKFLRASPMPDLGMTVKKTTFYIPPRLSGFIETRVRKYFYHATKVDLYRLCFRAGLQYAESIAPYLKEHFATTIASTLNCVEEFNDIYQLFADKYADEIEEYQQYADERLRERWA